MYYWMFSEWFPPAPRSGRAHQPVPDPAAEQPRTVDQRLLCDLAQALFDHPGVTGGTIDVQVQNGVAILDGEVTSAGVREAVLAAADAVDGIREVCSLLVLPGEPRGQ